MAETFRDIVVDSMRELVILQPTEQPSAADAQWVLSKLVRLFDNWNAYRPAVFCQVFTPFTFIPSQGTYTIGPTGADLTMTIRPVTLDGVNVILDNVNPPVRNPINVRDWQWWQNQTVQTIRATFPTDCYYKPDWPIGSISFWPIPTLAYQFELITRTLITEAITLNDVFSMPPGYRDAATLTLAESIAPSFERNVSADLSRMAREARARIFANNDFSGRLATKDAGMDTGASGMSTFNYRTGLSMPSNR